MRTDSRPNAGLLTLLQILCAAGLALGVVILLPTTLSKLPEEVGTFAWLLGGGYLLSATLLFWREYRGRPIHMDTLISALVLGFGPALIFAWHTHGAVPTRVLFPSIAWGAVLATVTVALRRRPGIRAVLLAVAALVTLVLPFSGAIKPDTPPSVRLWRLNSALYALKVTEYRTLIGPSAASGGAIAALRDRFVVANGTGELFLVSKLDAGGALTSQHLKVSVPINWREFAATFGEQEDVGNFRTADLLAQDLGETVRLFATHHFWKAQQKCFVVRVSMLEVNAARFMQGDGGNASWRTIFESTPCLPLDSTGRTLAHFGGIQIGGRLALLNPHELLVAVGDHEHDGVNSPEKYSQDLASSYGKTILLDLTDFTSRPYSIGHRNPQGLFADGPQAVWLTEHGPQGGDELNLIERGSNYGWPLATYGTQYGEHFWPGDAVPGSHGGGSYAEPFYSWVPSIGVSSLLVVHGAQFKLWDSDLLVASLRDGALYRARVRSSRIVMLERIPFGRRIRDITQGADGQFLMWTDKGALLKVETDNEVGTGESLFQACAGCHSIADGLTIGIGPDLRKVVDRPVATTVGYRYTAALKQLGGKWTRDRLDKFLTNPKAYVPGTRMQFAGLPDAADRRQLIEFLASGANNSPPPEDPPPN